MGEEISARIDEHRGWFIAVIALLTTGVTAGACPCGGGMFDIDGYVSTAREIRHAHLAPRRDRFRGFCVGDRTSRAAEFGAVDARFE